MKKIDFLKCNGSVGGAILLVSGLYGVLWGKEKEEGKSVRNENNADTVITLESITHH